jgi:hypothetical protein
MKFRHTRLTAARAKYGLSGAVSQSAKYARRSAGESGGSGLPSSGRGGIATPRRRCSASPSSRDCTSTSPARSPFFSPTRENRFANAQYSSWVHFSSGWLWHFAQPIDVPRKVTAVASARSLTSLCSTK